ncbi:MAG: hypothetical protein A3C35_06460 [Omnitrophica bacterium RIFCSPHIGHO2_02_FULL_46_11]|nr:MAG: hypothetical protein A3A81_05195 [Omnitrophica bacterium RIFCSPLOWO2_01_FULL_45_10b]OGW87710.1 MAG: hypothetical protein A3C35_06460 [Omnitrophica bacterium RIFCSPHIGHO2_02_FULL_46_11]
MIFTGCPYGARLLFFNGLTGLFIIVKLRAHLKLHCGSEPKAGYMQERIEVLAKALQQTEAKLEEIRGYL